MPENINEILMTVTVGLAVAAVALRILLRVNRVNWITRFLTWTLEYVDVGLSALLIALVIRSAVVEPFKIPSASMEDTLQIGDHLFVNRFIYGLRTTPWHVGSWHPFTHRPLAIRDPQRGDIVVFIPPHDRTKDFIKRVIGLPGDRIEIKRQVVYVNGAPLTEPYVVHKDSVGFGGALRRPVPGVDDMRATVVPPGHYFMMGDNRDRSQDSRFWGFASLDDFKGKAMLIYFSDDPEVPFYDLFHWIRWGRLFRVVG